MEEEPEVVFKALSDRGVYKVEDDETGATVMEITGYDLDIDFNMSYINSVEKVESTVQAIGELFRRAIMTKLLEVQNEQKE